MPDLNLPDLNLWNRYIESLDYDPRFVTVSGAHLYGFPSPDSDIDLRGCHQLPLNRIVGLSVPKETFERGGVHADIEVDIVSHDIGKYFRLLVKNNGYILEQVFSPLIVLGDDFLARLRPLALNCVTRHHYHHYRGFYATQRKLLEKSERKTVKALLYAYRVLATGIHLLDSGQVEANLLNLNEELRLPFIGELIAMKTEEKIAPADLDWSFHSRELDQLEARLNEGFETSTLREKAEKEPIDQLLVDLRLS